MMRRRGVLAAIAGTGAMRPSSLAAQQTTQRPRVGVLVYSTPDRDPSIQAFLRSMRELGYFDGQNITYEFRSAEGKPERLRESWSRLSEQIFRLDKWNLCRG